MDRTNPLRLLRRVAMLGRFGPPLMAFTRNCRAEGIAAHLLEISPRPAPPSIAAIGVASARTISPALIGTPAGLDEVARFVAEVGAEAIIGLSEAHLMWLRTHADRFEPGCRLLAPPLEVLRTVASKERQIEIAREVGFEVLETTLLRRPADVNAIPLSSYPVCIRPSNPIGIEPDLKARVFRDGQSLRAFLEGLRRFEQTVVAQPFHDAPDLKVHGARSEQGEILAMECFLVTRKFEGVTLTLERMAFPPGVEEACRAFAAAAGLVGGFHYDLLYLEKDRRTYYLEVNVRMGGVTDKAFRLGYNQPATILRCFGLAGPQAPLAPPRRDGPVVNKKAVVKHLLRALRGGLTELDYPNVSRPRHVAKSIRDLLLARDSVFDLHDLRGSLWFYTR